MRKKVLFISIIVGTVFAMTSCNKNYQKMTTEFVRNLPDTCELLVQVDNDAEHLVYYKSQRKDAFYCYNAELDNKETINVPEGDNDGNAYFIGAGEKNILVGYNIEGQSDPLIARASIQLYDIKTRSFKSFILCNDIYFDQGTKDITCVRYETDRYGTGTKIEEVYDFDGKLLKSKEVEVSDFEEVY